ncbi:MAG: hypothetical protein H0T50_10085 [Gemmatimonadales bacterium]|nr:hypothetical protein [Gemmatimonadales bacterium]
MNPDWLARIETLGTTAVVLMVGSMVIWHESVQRGGLLLLTVGSAVALYAVALLVCARRSEPSRVAWWPFALAGLVTGAVAELINARFLLTSELLIAAVTGVVIGTAHWVALRVWLGLTRRPAA